MLVEASHDRKKLTKNISSVVEVSSCSNQKAFGQKFGVFRTLFFSFVRIWVFSFIRTKDVEFSHNLSLQILPQFELLSVVTIWVFKHCHNMRFCVLSHFEFLSYVAIWVCFVLSHFEFCNIWVFEFSNVHQLGPLGRVGLVVAMSVYICIYMSPFHVIFLRPLIVPQVTW